MLANGLEMLLAALHLLRDGVDVAEASLERVRFEDRARSGGMIGHIDDPHRLVDSKGRGEPDHHPLLERDMTRSLDLPGDLLERLVQPSASGAETCFGLRYI